MTRLITGARKVSRKKGEGSFLGSSLARLSGFRICHAVEKEYPKTPLARRRVPKEIFYLRETK